MTSGAARTEFVKSFDRGLALIRAFGVHPGPMTLGEIADTAAVSPGVARRLLHTMVHLGYARRSRQGYRLDSRVLELGFRHLADLPLREVALPHLRTLVRTVNESSSVTVLSGVDIEYVARVQTTAIMTVTIELGTTFPAYLTSMGRVLLAAQPPGWLDDYLEQTEFRRRTDLTVTDRTRLRAIIERVRDDGYSLVDQELEPALRSVAVPVHDARGGCVAAVNVSAHAMHRDTDEMLGSILPVLRSVAADIERDMPTSGSRYPSGGTSIVCRRNR